MPTEPAVNGTMTNGQTLPSELWERLMSSGESSDYSNMSMNSSSTQEVSNDQYSTANCVTESQSSLDEEDSSPWWKGQEDIVISGISCRLPESNNMKEFAEHLLNGDDMITEDNRRWEPGLFGLPKRHGKLKELNRFDATFFGVHPKQANNMDPQLRMLLEVAYESLLDAGVNPVQIRGRRVGVFVGCSGSETAAYLTRDPDMVTGYSLTGCVRSMFANRLSYFLDFKGPSFAVDTACSSSLLALQLAVDAIRKDECEAALVAGTHLTLTPTTALQFMRLGLLSSRGMCQTFDSEGEGYVRSEGIVAIYLQKASTARRSYAAVLHAMSNTDGFKEQGITFPSGKQQARLLKTVYKEAGLDPSTVVYVETHGTGTKVGDPEEANALCEVYCANRKGALLVGSVKSNMGHAEPASGLAAIAKILIAMQSGYLPPNLHFKVPNSYIPGLIDGRLQVVTEKTQWNGGIVGVNSFGFGGSNTHVILKSHGVRKVVDAVTRPKYHLLCAAGRTQEGAELILSEMEARADDPYFLALMAGTVNLPAQMFPYRAYKILSVDPADKYDSPIQKYSTPVSERQVWFVYSGMGSQWMGMARDMVHAFPDFTRALAKCSQVLKPVGVSPLEMITKPVDGMFVNNPLNCFVCISAIQVALTDMLKKMGVQPDGIIGHSTGEMVAAYCDGCFTIEETMLTAYFRGKAMMDAKLPIGGMAAVGLTAEETQARCGKGVYVACHNAEDSTSISGELEVVKKLVDELQGEKVFAKMVDSSGMAFHSPLIRSIEHPLRAALKQVIKKPKRRSPRWISSSVPEDLWETDLGKYCSADYQVNNTLSPVLFYEALQQVPNDSIVIEVSPHSLLQSIVRRVVPSSCSYFGLMNSKELDNVKFFINSLGRLYQAGLPMDVQTIFCPVTLPVPLSTPMISPLIKWDHNADWPVVSMKSLLAGGTGGLSASCTIQVDPFNPEMKDGFYLDHIIDDRVLFPFTGHLINAWKAMCKIHGLDMEKTPVIIEDVHVYKATIITHPVKFDVIIGSATGNFEILESDSLAASGRITLVQDKSVPFTYENIADIPPKTDCERIQLNAEDVYKEMLIRGYEYGPAFRCISQACNSGDRALVEWNGNWVTFLDALLQTALLVEKMDTLKLPTRLRYLRIDPERHAESIINENDHQVVRSRHDLVTGGFIAGGVEVRELVAQTVPRRPHHGLRASLERVVFQAYKNDNCLRDVPTRDHIMKYTEICEGLFHDCLKKCGESIEQCLQLGLDKMVDLQASDKVDKATVDECLKDSKNGVVYLLHKIMTEPEHTASEAAFKELGASCTERYDNDVFWNSTLSEELLKPLLDNCLENNSGHSDRICIFEPLSLHIANVSREMQKSHPLVNVSWTYAGPDLSQLLNVHQADICNIEVQNENTIIPPENLNYDLTVLDRVLSRKRDIVGYLKAIKKFMRDDGFLLVNEITGHYPLAALLMSVQTKMDRQTEDKSRIMGMFLTHEGWLRTFDEADYVMINYQVDERLMQSLYLIRKRPSTPRVPHFVDIDDVQTFSWIQPLQETLENYAIKSNEDTVWIESTKTSDNGTIGLALCLREEHSKNKIRSVMLSNLSPATRDAPGQIDQGELDKIVQMDMHTNVYRDGVWGCFRHMRIKNDQAFCSESTEHAFINTLVRGDLNSLTWVSSANKYWPGDTDTKSMAYVYYASINFRDVMLATGRLAIDAIPGVFVDRECLLGMEFSGRLKSGQRVMGLSPCQAMATTVVADKNFLWNVPDHWTLEQAATVPVVYTTAFYALVVRGRLRRGDKVLIHSGSGGVGMAAITVALSYGCEVFTTVGTDEKKEYLKSLFPQLEEHHFCSSRTTEFEMHVLHQTKGKGVDLVLNSLSDDKLFASVRCLAQHGRFMEIGKYDLANDSKLGMSVFLKNATFHGILLDSLFEEDNKEWAEVVHLLNQGLASGLVKPLPTTVFDNDKVEEAFRFMASGKHKGKVLLKVRQEEADKRSPPCKHTVQAAARSYCCPEHVYIITGGLGGFGLEFANWLVARGAKKLVLTSRNGVKSNYQARSLYFWRRMGVSVNVSTLNIMNKDETEKLFHEAMEMGPIGGIFHLAMVLRDCIFENQTISNFVESAQPKYWGTKNLDECSRACCGDELKWFVVFSSISCGRGNAGQTNYGWANSCMERIVEKRMADRLPGMAIQWGAIGDVGVIMEKMGGNSSIIGGTLPQRIVSCLQCLDSFLSWKSGIFSSYIRADLNSAQQIVGPGDIMQTIAHILGLSDLKQVDMNSNLGDLGLDSLMGVEIKQTLERDFDIMLTMKDIRSMTLNKLAELAANSESSSRYESPVEKDANIKSLMAMFRLYFDVNALRPELPLVPINSVKVGKPIFFVHPIEGVGSSLEQLASCLNYPAYCLQCTEDVPLVSMQSVASYYIERMKEVQPEPPYRIVGYSYGANIAFQMANLLQQASNAEEETRVVEALILLDSSHKYMRLYREAYRMAYGVANPDLKNDPMFDSEILCAFSQRFAETDYFKMYETLMQLPSWESRVQYTSEKLMATGSFEDRTVLEFALNSLRQKFLVADKYKPKRKYNGDITLIKSSFQAGRQSGAGDDYGLKEVTNGDVFVHVVDGDHYTFIHDAGAEKTATIIADLLEKTGKAR